MINIATFEDGIEAIKKETECMKAQNKVMKETLEEHVKYLEDRRAMTIGQMIMEKDSIKKIELFNQQEELKERINKSNFRWEGVL